MAKAAVYRIVVKWSKPHVELFTDYGDGVLRISASFPTGAYAGYQSAIDANRAECRRKIDEFIAQRRKLLSHAEITVEVQHAEEEA